VYENELYFNFFFQNPGRLKLQSNSVIFKNNKTGKVEQFPGIEVETSEWLKRARGHNLAQWLQRS
jgi:hypothetical protein